MAMQVEAKQGFPPQQASTVLHHLTRSLSRTEMILTRILDSAGTPWVLIAETHGLTHQAI